METIRNTMTRPGITLCWLEIIRSMMVGRPQHYYMHHDKFFALTPEILIIMNDSVAFQREMMKVMRGYTYRDCLIYWTCS